MSSYQLEFENAQIGLKNFEGREGRYNKEGERSFVIFLTEEQANDLIGRGLNVKPPKYDEDGNPLGRPFIKVKVRFDVRPPEIFFSRGEKDDDGRFVIKPLIPTEVRTLDKVDLDFVDLRVNVREWDKGKFSIFLDSGVFIAKRNPMIERYAIQD